VRKPISDETGGHDALGVPWIDQLSVKALDTSHRDAGMWAFETYNPNAMKGAAEHMAHTAADFVAFQETKVARVAVKDVETATSNSGWEFSLEGCLNGDGGGNSAGAAVACRRHVGMAISCDDDVIPDNLKGRFKIRLIGAVVKGGYQLW